MPFDPSIRVMKADAELIWNEVPRPEGDETPPGEDVQFFESADGKFTAGLWRRPVREGAMTRPYHEVSIIIDGIAEVMDPDGTVHRAGPGDVLVTPRGSSGVWRCVTDVKKFWAICETDEEAPGAWVVEGDSELDWQEVPRPEGDTAPPGEETVIWRSDDGNFVCGFWRRGPEEGDTRPPYHEVSYVLEGQVLVTEPSGTVHDVGPGDTLITPNGSEAVWKSLSPVCKFWVIYKSD